MAEGIMIELKIVKIPELLVVIYPTIKSMVKEGGKAMAIVAIN